MRMSERFGLTTVSTGSYLTVLDVITDKAVSPCAYSKLAMILLMNVIVVREPTSERSRSRPLRAISPLRD